jgi:hypothetical protein
MQSFFLGIFGKKNEYQGYLNCRRKISKSGCKTSSTRVRDSGSQRQLEGLVDCGVPIGRSYLEVQKDKTYPDVSHTET